MAKIALLIGVSEYEPGLSPLPAAVKDLEAMQRVLLHPEMGGFDQVKQLTNPEPQSMQYEIETIFSSCNKNDLVLLFFSGHGIKDDHGKLYFATRITRKSNKGELIRSTAVPSSFVHDIMNNSRCRRQVIILDCCFSGAFDLSLQSKDDGSIDLQNQLGAEGRVVLTSSSSTQYSYEQIDAEFSIYTRYLIEGIETGDGDLDGDGNISIRDLHEYVSSKVHETASSMTPKIITQKDQGYNIILAKAQVLDPILKYRKEAQNFVNQGEISSVGRVHLNAVQNQLGISMEAALEIENEVLKPYRKRLENLQRYRQAFLVAIENKYPINEMVLAELRNLSKILRLQKEDIDLIESDELRGKVSNEIRTLKPWQVLKSSRQFFWTLMTAGILLITSSIVVIKNMPNKNIDINKNSLPTPKLQACGSGKLRDLDRQIIFEMQKNNPKVLTSFLGSNAEMSAQNSSFPLLQPVAKKSLEQAIKKRMKKLVVNSAYRSPISQQLLKIYADGKKCAIGAVGKPGTSRHETGLAIDIEDYMGWEPYLKAEGWSGSEGSDPSHFDFDTPEANTKILDVSNLAIQSFQHLWNINNSKDKIPENGIYDNEISKRLGKFSLEGFNGEKKCEISCGIIPETVDSLYKK